MEPLCALELPLNALTGYRDAQRGVLECPFPSHSVAAREWFDGYVRCVQDVVDAALAASGEKMVKLIVGKADGSTTWMFGLSEGNLRLLKQGKPILFNLSEMGLPPQEVAIFYGATEEIMETQVRDALRGGTP